jgi:DNA-3-methyladenine glycosylase
MKKLPRRFYNRNTIIVAKELLGKYLIHQANGIKQIGKIVEVEAYLGAHDLAAHTARGLTNRTRIMFGPPGYAYVYLIYGMYYCMNVVTEGEGQGSAILLRALEPIKNISTKTTGPGLLCKAMHINKTNNGQDLCSTKLYIAAGTESDSFKIVKTPRIGVDYAKHWAKRHLRFYIKDNLFVSKLRKIHGSQSMNQSSP